MQDILTPQLFDTLIIVVIVIGLALAVVRLIRDFTRPMPPDVTPAPAERGYAASSPRTADEHTSPTPHDGA
ncbi:MAG: hypothetical protein SF162_17340 [bacterium]|nr:hypothetical protein [bacterium]